MIAKWLCVTCASAMAAYGLAASELAAQPAGPAESFELDGVRVTIFAAPFLTEEELQTLRVVGQNRDALSIFVPEGDGYAAIAIAPAEGLVRNGIPANSAMAIAGLPDIATARARALEGCNALRSGGGVCEVVLEVAPR
ncbi:MAG: hypothetical protein ACXIU7_10905 [Roseinatronobacter sp.]